MKEAAFTRSTSDEVSKIDASILCWKVNDPFSSGWPDNVYVGDKRTVFVEYKLLKRSKMPLAIKPALSAEQVSRLRKIFALQPDNVKVVVGVWNEETRRCIGLAMFHRPDQWENKTNTDQLQCFETRALFASWLVSHCQRPKGDGEVWTHYTLEAPPSIARSP